jgi:DNA-binding ferritin-like protein
VLLHSGTNAHLLHWTTKSYAHHQALGEYYQQIPELVDQLAEAFDDLLAGRLAKGVITFGG